MRAVPAEIGAVVPSPAGGRRQTTPADGRRILPPEGGGIKTESGRSGVWITCAEESPPFGDAPVRAAPATGIFCGSDRPRIRREEAAGRDRVTKIAFAEICGNKNQRPP